VGGAIIMNASCKYAISDNLSRIHVLRPDGEDVWVNARDIDFSYRSSAAGGLGVILGAEFILKADSPERIRARTKDLMSDKMSKQPLNKRTLGCVFKNPASCDETCGKLIDEADLKNARVGGAVISSKHANFIVNQENASARDVIELMDMVADRVYDKFSVELEPEIRII